MKMKQYFSRIKVIAARIRGRFSLATARLSAPLRAILWLADKALTATMRIANFALVLVILLAVLDRIIGTPAATEWVNSISNTSLQQLVVSVMEAIPAIVDEIGEFARHIANRFHLSNADPLSYANEGYVNMTDLASRLA